MEFPGLKIVGLSDGEPEGTIDLLMINTIDWVISTLLIVSLEDLKADQGVAMLILSLEIGQSSVSDIWKFLGEFMPIWSFLEIDKVGADLGEF